MKALTEEEKWIWKMNYCKAIGVPPAHKWAWDKAETAYQKQLEKSETEKPSLLK